MMSLSDDTQADIIEAFNSTFRYLDNLSNINNPYFEGIVTQIYLTDLQLNKATVATFLDLYLLIWNGFVSSKINGKCNDFDFDIVYFPFLGGDVPQAPPPPPPHQFPAPPILVKVTFLSLLGLLECLNIWLTSMLVTKL